MRSKVIAHLLAYVAVVSGLAGPFACAADTYDLDTANSPLPWIFSNGPEYPGATGSISQVPGLTGSAIGLNFDTSQGGNYVSASYDLPPQVSAEAISLWVRHPGGVCAQLRVVDSTGQTLQYCPNRPFNALDPNQWYHLVVNLGQSEFHWGGSNDGIVHNPIAEVSVVAKPTLIARGTLDIEQVEALPSLVLKVDPAAEADPTGVAQLNPGTGVEMEHTELQAPQYDLAQSLGFKWVRTEMFWTDVESVRGVYDFILYDQIRSNLASRWMRPHFILCYGNPLYTGGTWLKPPVTPAAVQAFAAFAQAATAHFAGQGVQFEVWNEPNISLFWPDPNAAAYAQLAKASIPLMHSADSSTNVSTGGMAGLGLGFLHRLIPAGGAAAADAIALHPYRSQEPELLSGDLTDALSRLAATVPANPKVIWSTEAGYSSGWYGNGHSPANRTLQAIYGARQILTASALGIPFQVVFALHDHGTDAWNTQDNFGIFDNAYQPKPMTSAVRTLLSQCAGMTFLGNLPSPEASLHILKFQDSNRTMLILWSDAFGSEGEEVSLAGAPIGACTYLGTPLTLATGADGQTALHVAGTPIYVSFAR
jgi:hypothetical protein